MKQDRKTSEPPWATVSGAMRSFLHILRTTWFDPDGWDSDGDEYGLDLLLMISPPADPVLAERLNRLTEDFRIYVSDGRHADSNHPDRKGWYFMDEAQAILNYLAAHPEQPVAQR